MQKKEACPHCGARATRACPALNSGVCAPCCAATRNTAHACPATCAHNLFGTTDYSRWLTFETRVLAEIIRYAMEKIGSQERHRVMDDLQTALDKDLDELPQEIIITQLVFAARLPDGRTVLDAFVDERSAHCSNDEHFYMSHLRATHLTILEIQEVCGTHALRCRDYLDPAKGEFYVHDRAVAASTCRFACYLTWLVHLPFFARVVWTGSGVAHELLDEFVAGLREDAGLRRDEPARALKPFLAAHYADALGLLHDLTRAARDRMLRSMNLQQCTAQYTLLVARDAFLAALAAKPEFEREEQDAAERDEPPGTLHYVWLRRGESKAIENDLPPALRHNDDEAAGVGLLANMKIREHTLDIEAMSTQKLAFAKKMMKRYFGRLAHFDRELTVDLAQQLADRIANEDDDPPAIAAPAMSQMDPAVERAVMTQFYTNLYQKLPDMPLPALQGQTPRQAAQIPQMRPALLALMKGHCHNLDRACAEKNMVVNIDWLLKELGLHELLRTSA